MVVEPVVDGPGLEAELHGEVLHGLGAGVGVQEEGDVESLPLLLAQRHPRLLSGAGQAGLGGRVTVVI